MVLGWACYSEMVDLSYDHAQLPMKCGLIDSNLLLISQRNAYITAHPAPLLLFGLAFLYFMITRGFILSFLR